MSDQEYEIEAIVDVKSVGRGKHYLVKWKGYPDSENTWEPSTNLEESMIKQFQSRKDGKFPLEPAKKGRIPKDQVRNTLPDKKTLKKVMNQ